METGAFGRLRPDDCVDSRRVALWRYHPRRIICRAESSAAAAFSFFLAIPILAGASAVELISSLDEITPDVALTLAIGTIVSAIFALLAVSWLLRYVTRNKFTLFGYYRIALGVIVLLFLRQP